jgi:hypothetical protein
MVQKINSNRRKEFGKLNKSHNRKDKIETFSWKSILPKILKPNLKLKCQSSSIHSTNLNTALKLLMLPLVERTEFHHTVVQSYDIARSLTYFLFLRSHIT